MKKKEKAMLEQEIADWYFEYKEAVEKVNKLKEARSNIEKKVEVLMDECGKGEITLDLENLDKLINCRRILNRKVIFYPEKLEAKIKDKEILEQIIDKTYVVNDWKKFAKFLKSKGIKAKDIVKFINVQKDVNNNQIEQLENIGMISYKDISGCYVCREISSYIRFSFKNK